MEGGQPRFFRHDPNKWLEPKEAKQGRRTDLKEALEKHSCYGQLVRDDPAIAARLGRVARDYYIFGNKTTVFDDKPEVIWLYGATG